MKLSELQSLWRSHERRSRHVLIAVAVRPPCWNLPHRPTTFTIYISAKEPHVMPNPTGTVSVVDTLSNATVATGTLDANGNATLSWVALTGTYNFVVNYGGDANFDPGTSAPIPYVVNAILLPVTVNATVAPPSPAPAGTAVAFTVGVVAQPAPTPAAKG